MTCQFIVNMRAIHRIVNLGMNYMRTGREKEGTGSIFFVSRLLAIFPPNRDYFEDIAKFTS